MRQGPWEFHLFIPEQPRALTSIATLQAAPSSNLETQQQEQIQALQQQQSQHQGYIQSLQAQLQVQAAVQLQSHDACQLFNLLNCVLDVLPAMLHFGSIQRQLY